MPLFRALLLIVALALILPLQVYAQSRPDLLEVLEISGEINDGTAMQVRSNVETIAENPKVKAVLLVVKSPGGGVMATADIYQAIGRLTVPVVGWCSGMCASGGIYVLMAPSVKYIGISEGAISGSVGVVMQVAHFNRLLDKLLIDIDIFKSGILKTAGSPTQAMSDAEKKYLQSLTDEFAGAFYAVVAKARPKIADWDAVKSARVFIGAQAVKVGLVDSVMSRASALAKAKELSGSKSIYTREELKKMSRAADERPTYTSPTPPASMTAYGDIAALIEMVKEVRRGESVRFSYRMPMEF